MSGFTLLKLFWTKFQIDTKHQPHSQRGHMINSSLISFFPINETTDWCRKDTAVFSSRLHYLHVGRVVILNSSDQSDDFGFFFPVISLFVSALQASLKYFPYFPEKLASLESSSADV